MPCCRYEELLKSMSSPPFSSSSSSSAARGRRNSSLSDCEALGLGITLPEAAELSPPRCEWEFRLAASVPSPALPGASDAIGSMDFDPTGRLLATGGIARKIRMYGVASLLHLDDDDSGGPAPASCICVPAKLSSVRWRAPEVVGCGDYDGVVTEYDVESGLPAWERDEHSGRRVWAVDYAPGGAATTMAASGSDDRTAHVWDPRAPPSAGWATARAGGAVLCVEFDPSGAPQLAVGSADRRAALYDVRALGRGPVSWMEGHRRAVTYVRWAGARRRLVTSAADGTHRLWDAPDAGEAREVRSYSGHASARSFVGMGVWRQAGLVASGSESNHVFVYDLRWGKPIWVHPFLTTTPGGVHTNPAPAAGNNGGFFVSAVAWRQGTYDADDLDGGALVAGGSDGALKMFTCHRRNVAVEHELPPPSVDVVDHH